MLSEPIRSSVPWDEIIGNEIIKLYLKNIIETRRLANAYIFDGTEGIGKKLMATKFSKALLCKNPIDGNPCESCTSCSSIKRNISTNIKIITKPKDKKMGIDLVRDMEIYFYYKPIDSELKIAIVDDAHFLSVEAMNAMLKILEEPPPYGVLILITSNIDALLPTIRSRCQRIRFCSLTGSDFGKLLKKKYNEISSEKISLLGEISLFDIWRAQSFVEKKMEPLFEDLQIKLSSHRIGRLCETIISQYSEKDDIKLLLEFILSYLRQIVMYKYNCNHKPAFLNEQFLNYITSFGDEKILGIMEDIIVYQRYIDLNVNPKLVLENALLKLA